MKKAIYLIVFAFVISGCEKVFIGEDESNTPINNFEIFWNDFDQHYSLFTVRDIDWDELYSVYRPQVTNTTSDEELWSIFSNLIEHLDDSHTSIYDGNGNYYTSGNALSIQSESEISEELIVSKYLDFVEFIPTEEQLAYGKIKDKNIGYIYLGIMDGENPAVIDNIVSELDSYNAIIFDLRQNQGGDDRYSARIAQAFSDGEHFIYTVETRNGENYTDFDEVTEFYTKVNNAPYLKPVIVLTDIATISSGEVFLLHMKSYEHVTQMGDATAGDFSTVSNIRFLPNGWHYQYSIQKLLLPNGESLDGIGHIPDVYVKNTETDIENETDLVIEEAIGYLFSEYGI